ncbi:MAG: hypothetical protein HRU27_20000, partial [Rhizobiaceae bacterium]|nr:hypothetical protein [Rhizobiaceae bacterium]
APSDLHPAVVDRIAHNANKIHEDRSVLRRAQEFPNTNSPPAPFNDVAWHMINSGPNILHEVFPYWVAAQFGRVLLFVLPLIFLAPSLRLFPALYVWFQNRRVWRHYQSIAALDMAIENATSAKDVKTIALELEKLEVSLAKMKLPLAYRQKAYDARLHIDLINQKIDRWRSDQAHDSEEVPVNHF